jgi:hypothetical protein
MSKHKIHYYIIDTPIGYSILKSKINTTTVIYNYSNPEDAFRQLGFLKKLYNSKGKTIKSTEFKFYMECK